MQRLAFKFSNREQVFPILTLIGVFLVITPFFIAGYILHQIDKQAKKVRAGVRIWLVDLFSLTFLIQLPLSIVVIDTEMSVFLAGFLTLLFSGIMTLIWWTTIKTVSRAGIIRVGWRSAISLVVIPMMYLGSFAMIGIAIQLLNHVSSSTPFYWLLLAEGVLLSLMLLSWYIVKRAIASSFLTPSR